jgi:hypothetical protein
MQAEKGLWEVVVRWEGEDWRVGVWRDTTVGQLKVLLEALYEPRLLRPNAQRLVLGGDGSSTPHAELEDHAPLRQYGLLLAPAPATATAAPFLHRRGPCRAVLFFHSHNSSRDGGGPLDALRPPLRPRRCAGLPALPHALALPSHRTPYPFFTTLTHHSASAKCGYC